MENFKEFKITGIWKDFLRNDTGQRAKCKICYKVIKCTGGSTKGLHVHIQTMHGGRGKEQESLAEEVQADQASQPSSSAGPAPKKIRIDSFFPKKDESSLDATLGRMCSRDGISFNLFCTSNDLRQLLSAKGFKDVPTSPNGIKNRVMAHCRKIMGVVKSELKDNVGLNKRFTLTLDEYTSLRNRRYMSVNVHCGADTWGLGVIRCHGSMPAEKCVEVLDEKLRTFDIDLNRHIVCVCTDGASVMKKFGRLIPCMQQLCMAHGLHLAVMDALYEKRVSTEALRAYQGDDKSSAEETDDEGEVDDHEAVEHFEASVEGQRMEVSGTIGETISKVRKIVRWFKKSPVRNECLQKHVGDELGSERTMMLDCRTRWNSLLIMIERFWELKTAVRKALIDIQATSGSAVDMLTNDELSSLRDLISALNVLKVGTEMLCRRDANLLTSDVTMSFILTQLRSQTSPTAARLLECVRKRVLERRTIAASVLQHLHQGHGSSSDPDLPFAGAKDVSKIVVELVSRLSSKEATGATQGPTELSDSDDNDGPSGSLPVSGSDALKATLEQSLREVINKVEPEGGEVTERRLQNMVKQELANLAYTGRGFYTGQAYQWLKTVVPTSVEAERVFSSVGNVVTKLRTRLNDETVNALVFLKTYYSCRT